MSFVRLSLEDGVVWVYVGVGLVGVPLVYVFDVGFGNCVYPR